MSSSEIIPLGETAFIVRLSASLDLGVNAKVRAFTDALESAALPAIHDVVPANSSIGIYFDAPENADSVRLTLSRILETNLQAPHLDNTNVHEIPVTYNGPDLTEVAAACALSERDVADIHSAHEYQVFAIGFAPGFAYLGELDERIALPRRSKPRTRVPAGSVAIANRQTAIYPFETPGGWNLIGTTSVIPFDAQRTPASIFAVGDRVRFVRT